MTETVMAPNEIGVTLFKLPPSDFDPLQASARELVVYGYPARPDASTQPALAERWTTHVSKKRHRIEPVFVGHPDKIHGPMRAPSSDHPVPSLGAKNATSTNWSGSAVFAAQGDAVSWVEGVWTVPDPGDPQGGKSSYYSSAWVGIDGWGSPDVLQAGTESSFINGGKSVYAWWEWYPNYEIAIANFPVSPGDEMVCLICATSTTTAGVYLTNSNTDQHVSFSITAPGTTTLVGNCAEWIVETPSVGGQPTTLPDYGMVFFDETLAGTKNKATLDGFTGTPITLVGGGKNLSVPTLEKAQLVKLTYQDV
jgi:Peptidase A4 family